MNVKNKTKQELLKELNELQVKNDALIATYEQYINEHKGEKEKFNISHTNYQRLFESAKVWYSFTRCRNGNDYGCKSVFD